LGLYHCAGGGYASRYEWARAILELDPNRRSQAAPAVEPARTADFPMPAARPLFSALDCGSFEREFGLHITPWREALKLAMGE
jgi:dTDP-4-dehydrorhamnose reductase